MSLLLFLPTENKEINKGLYSGTSSFSVSADSISPNRAVRYVHLSDGWCTQSIYPPRPLSLTDTEMSHLRCTVAGCSALLHQRQGGRARGEGRCVWKGSPLNQSHFCGQIGHRWLTNELVTEAGSFLRFFPPFGLFWAENMRSFLHKILFVSYTKHPFQHTGVYLYEGLCMWLMDRLAPRLVCHVCFL